MLQEHVHYQNQVNELKCKNEQLKQYGKRLCARIEGIPSVENEAHDEVLDKVMSFNAQSWLWHPGSKSIAYLLNLTFEAYLLDGDFPEC